MYYACLCGHYDIVQFFLTVGAGFDMQKPEDHRYYLAALTEGIVSSVVVTRIDIRHLLSSHKGSVNLISAIFKSARNGKIEELEKNLDRYREVFKEKTIDFSKLSEKGYQYGRLF